MTSTYTSREDFQDSYNTLFTSFASHKTKSLAWRKWQLKQCWWMVDDNEAAITNALRADLNRHDLESHLSDINGVKTDIIAHIKNLEKWTADVRPDAGFLFKTLAKARMRKEPLGVALIISAWNFPFLLAIRPLISAIAAGCCVMVKPSELAMHTQNLIAELIPKYLDTSAIRCVTAGPTEMSYILIHKFNHIFYTGSSKIARIVAAAAAKHLTPCVLELGGQGPAIVTRNADVDMAAKRVAWAKFLNAGQICLSVNHVFCDPAIYEAFIERLTYWNGVFRNGNDEGMVKIVNERNYKRLEGLLGKTEGKVIAAAESKKDERYFAPTIVRDVKMDDALLSEELFGPIAPVVEASLDEAIRSVNALPDPLAVYIFSKSRQEIDRVLNETLSGGVCVNDVILHASVPDAPFGGVGESGTGSYHGPYGIDAFSHLRTVIEPPTWLERFIKFRYPPLDIANKSKLEVKNKLGFQKGESMADQVIKGQGPGLIIRVLEREETWAFVVGLGAIAMTDWAAFDWAMMHYVRDVTGL